MHNLCMWEYNMYVCMYVSMYVCKYITMYVWFMYVDYLNRYV